MAIYKIIISGEFGINDHWFTLRLQNDAEWAIPKEGEAIRIAGDELILSELNSKTFILSFKPPLKLQNIELYAETDAPIIAIEASVPSHSSILTVSSSVDSHVSKAEIGRPNIFKFDLRLV